MIRRGTKPYGKAALMELLRDVEFPVSKQILITRCGHEEVQWTRDRAIKLRNCLLGVGQREFHSAREATEAISNNLRDTAH